MEPMASLFPCCRQSYQDSVLDEIQELLNSCHFFSKVPTLLWVSSTWTTRGGRSCVPVGCVLMAVQGYTQGLCSGPHKLLLKLFLLRSCALPTPLLSTVYLPPLDRCMCPQEVSTDNDSEWARSMDKDHSWGSQDPSMILASLRCRQCLETPGCGELTRS